jgi:hypothetical protein
MEQPTAEEDKKRKEELLKKEAEFQETIRKATEALEAAEKSDKTTVGVVPAPTTAIPTATPVTIHNPEPTPALEVPLEAKDFIDKLELEPLLPKEFGRLKEEQKVKVIADLKRRIVDIVKSDAQTQYSETLKGKSGIKRYFSNISKEKNLKNIEAEVFKTLIGTPEGQKLISEDIKVLTERASIQEISRDEDTGESFVVYLKDKIPGSLEESLAIADFNKKANEFTKIPYEWGQEKKGKHKKAYDEARAEYETARNDLLQAKTHEKTDKDRPDIIVATIMQADNAVQMEQLLNTHPEFEKALNDFEKSGSGMELARTGKKFLESATLERLGLLAGGAGARTLVKGVAVFSGAPIITAIAAPIVGGAVGYLRGKFRAKDELTKRQKGARHGKKDESKEATNTESAENLSERMVAMLETLKNVHTGEQYKKRLDQIKRRIEYTQSKLKGGLVDFGDAKTALINQFNLISNLNTALTISASMEETVRKDVDERLDRFLSYRGEKIEKAQSEFIKKQARKGMIYGASFALAGYGARALGEHFGWWGNNGAENTEHPTGARVEQTHAPKIIPEKVLETPTPANTEPGHLAPTETTQIETTQHVPEATPTEVIKPEEIAIIQKGEGIEHAFRRQIEHNIELAKSLGFKGDINDPKALHAFSGGPAHRVALEHGYVDKVTGEEIRIKTAGAIAYQLKLENGELKVDEIKAGGGLIEEHGKGSQFEKDTEEYEYKSHATHKTVEDLGVPKSSESFHLVNGHPSELGKFGNVDLAETHSGADHPESTEVIAARAKVFAGMEGADKHFLEGTPHKDTAESVLSETMTSKRGTGLMQEYRDIIKNHPEFAKYSKDFTPVRLVEFYETHKGNTNYIFRDDASNSWENLKDLRAMKLLDQTGSSDPATKHLAEYIRLIRQHTGLNPKSSWSIFGRGKTAEEYIVDGLKILTENEKLGQFKVDLRK